MCTQEESEHFGVDWEELPAQFETKELELPETRCPCSDEVLAMLRDNYDPLACCDDYGNSKFLDIRNYIMQFVEAA